MWIMIQVWCMINKIISKCWMINVINKIFNWTHTIFTLIFHFFFFWLIEIFLTLNKIFTLKTIQSLVLKPRHIVANRFFLSVFLFLQHFSLLCCLMHSVSKSKAKYNHKIHYFNNFSKWWIQDMWENLQWIVANWQRQNSIWAKSIQTE